MPVNNDFLEAFPTELAPRFAISCDIFFAGMFTFFSWKYATAGNRLADATKMSPGIAKFMSAQAPVMPAVAIIAAAAILHAGGVGCSFVRRPDHRNGID